MTIPSERPRAIPLPTLRKGLFDPPQDLASFREDSPVRPLAYPDGKVGWLVTSHDLAREVLADSRFTMASAGLPTDRAVVRRPVMQEALERLAAADDPAITTDRAGSFIMMDPPAHTRFRRLLAGHLSARRMGELRPQVQHMVSVQLDAMHDAGPTLDLAEYFARPIPLLTMCKLLGLPSAAQTTWREKTEVTENPASSVADHIAAIREFDDFMRAVIRHKRIRPGEDLLSHLTQSGDLTEDELVGVGKLLFSAGNDTTSNMFGLGTFALLHERSRWDELRAEPAQISDAIEELLRYLTILQLGAFSRTALEDLHLGDVVVRAGQRVSVSLSAANRDPAVFARPDELDFDRDTARHLAFSYGIHQCLGQHLARVEMQVGFASLMQRFPNLRLTVPAEEVPMFPGDNDVYGVERLPVTW